MSLNRKVIQSTSVLGSPARKKMPPARLTKAHKFFQDSKGKIPLPVQHLPYTTGCLSPVDRLPRPPNAVVPTYNPDDPFAQIERATNKIEKLVTKYENDSEDSHLKMLAELDSSFQINALEPDEILDQSKRVVDNLISQNKELKDTQSSMLGSVQTWLQREEQVLRDQDDDMKIIAKEVFSLPQNSDEMMEVLNSSTGSNQERIARAMSLHTDIIAKSNLLVQGLQKKMLEQMRLIKELEEKLAAAEPKMGRRSKRDNIGKVDYQKQLEQAMTRIGQQEDTIKKLNEKIEQLIGQSVLTSRDVGDESLMEDNLQKSHDLMAMECKIGNLENLLNTASDSIFKMKHDIQGLEADKAYLLTQVQGLKELVEVERCKREAQTREFLNKLADEDDGSGKNTRAIEDMKNIVALEKEITRLKNQIEDEKKKANEENQKHLDQLKKEFDLRQLEMKKRQTAAAMSGGNHSAVLEAMQKQHDEETEYLKKSYLEQIAKLKKMHQEELKKQSDEKDKIITDLQLLNHKILSEKGGVDLGNHIEMLTKQFEDKEIELKQQLHDKLENARNDFQKHQAKLMEEIRKKEEEIANMTIAINELTKKPPKIPKPETPPPPTPVEEEKPKEEEDKSEKLEIDADLPDDAKSAMIDYQMKLEKLYTKKLHQQKEDIEKRWRQQLEEQTEALQAEINAIQKEYAYTIEALNVKISKLEAEKSPIDTNDDGEIEELRAKIKELEKEIQVKEGEKLKYQIENELLQKAATAGNDDFALIELTQAFAEQTQELNSLKQKYDDVKDQLLLYKDKTEKAEKKLMKSSRISSREYEFIFNDILWLAPPDPMPENVEPIIEKAPHIFKKYFEVTSDISPQIQELLARTRGTTPASVHVDLDFSGTNSLEVPDIDENSENPIPEVRTIIQTIETPRPMVRLLTEISHQFWVDFVLPEYVEPLPYLPPNPILPKTFHNQLLKGEFVEIAPIIKRLSFKKPALQFFTDEKLPLNRSHFAPVAFSVEPKVEIKVDEAKLEGGFVSVRQMIISKAIPLNFFEEKTDIGCQIDRIEIKTPHLRSQPPIEVITIEQGICRPPDAVILDPSPIVAPLPPKPDAPPRPNQIITAAGELINIPPVNSVTAETDKEAVDTIKKMALQETRDLSKQLELVISEMQTIDQEQDPVKKLQLQETLGISLDVEKDSLISEMKERITELEQLIANSSEQPEEDIIVEKANYVNTETDAVEGESVQAMEIGTQTMYSARPSSAHLSSYHSIIDIKDEAIIQRPKSATMKLESQEIYKKSQAQLTTQRQPSLANIKKVNDTDVCSSSTQVTVETIKEETKKAQLFSSNVIEISARPNKLVLSTTSNVIVSTPGEENKKPKRPSLKNKEPIIQYVEIKPEEKPVEEKEEIPPVVITETEPIEQITTERMSEETQSSRNVSTVIQQSIASIDPTPKINVQLDQNSIVNTSTTRLTNTPINTNSANLPQLQIQENTIHEESMKEIEPRVIEIPIKQEENKPSEQKRRIILSFTSCEEYNVAPVKEIASIAPLDTTRSTINNEPPPVEPMTTHDIKQEPMLKASDSQSKIEKIENRPIEQEPPIPVAPPPAKRKKMTLAAAPIAARQKSKINSLQTNIKEIDIKPSLTTEQEEIMELKAKIAQLQSSSSPAAASNILAGIVDTIDEIDEGVENPNVIRLDSHDFTRSSANLLTAINTTNDIAKRILNRQASTIDLQDNIVHHLSGAASGFLNTMDQEGGARAENQSEFLRNVNNAVTGLGSSVTNLRAEEEAKELMQALDQAKEELKNQEKIIRQMRKEIIDLKAFKDAPQVVSQFIQIRDDLKNLINNTPEKNKILTNFESAKRILPQFLARAKKDNTIVATGSSEIVQEALDSLPNWRKAQGLLDIIVSNLIEDTSKQRNQSLINELNDQIKKLIDDNSALRTDKLGAERDLLTYKSNQNRTIDQLKNAITVANDQIAMLERQLKASHRDEELATAQALERQRMEELRESNEQKAKLQAQYGELDEKYQNLQQRFNDIFNQATDTQTSNQVLQSRTNEMLKRAEIDNNKARTLEKINQSNAKELDNFTEQLSNKISENVRLSNELSLKNTELQDLKRQLFDAQVNGAMKGQDIPRIIKLYQQQSALYQQQLQYQTGENMKLKARRAEDARNLVMMRRDIARAKNETRMMTLKYECVREELIVMQKSIAARDETIRALKREIDRLRNLLKMNRPLKAQLQKFEKEKNDNQETYQKMKEKIEETKKRKEMFGKNPEVSSYFDGMLRRHYDTLAKLERERRSYAEIEERNKVATLQAVSQIVRESEMSIPESVILQLMPRPAPARIKKPPIIEDDEDSKFIDHFVQPGFSPPKYRTASYADTLQMIGSLVGKKSPEALQKMLRNARHSKIIYPENDGKRQSPKRQQKAPQKQQKQQLGGLTVKPFKAQK